jgi:hypothetical protein
LPTRSIERVEKEFFGDVLMRERFSYSLSDESATHDFITSGAQHKKLRAKMLVPEGIPLTLRSA